MLPISADSRRLILLAEDDIMVRDLVRTCLQRRTYQVLVASNGKEAIELSKKHPGVIDLFLTDVDMPFVDGVAAYQVIHERRPEIKVLFMSGWTVPSDLPDPCPFLPKPFAVDDLFNCVEEIFSGSQAGC